MTTEGLPAAICAYEAARDCDGWTHDQDRSMFIDVVELADHPQPIRVGPGGSAVERLLSNKLGNLRALVTEHGL